MNNDSQYAIQGGTRFFEPDDDYDYNKEEQEQEENQITNVAQYKQIKIIQPGRVIFEDQVQQTVKPQTSSNAIYQVSNQNSSQKIIKPRTMLEQPVNKTKPSFLRVEDRLILFKKRRLEKLEKQRIERFDEILRPAPSHTNKENKKTNNDVFLRLYSSTKKGSQVCLPKDFTTSQKNDISLFKVIKPMPGYAKKSPEHEYDNQYQASSKKSLMLNKNEMQSVVLHNYMESNKNKEYFSSSTCTNWQRSPCKVMNDQSNFFHQQRDVLEQRMEAYFRKQREKDQEY